MLGPGRSGDRVSWGILGCRFLLVCEVASEVRSSLAQRKAAAREARGGSSKGFSIMAIIKMSALVSGVRGTVGGTVFSANKSGAYVKPWRAGAAKRTNLQAAQRRRMARTPGGWRDLDADERLTWSAWAAEPAQEKTNSLGEAYYLSGYQWYVTLAMWADTVGIAPRREAPENPWPVAPSVSSLICDVDSGLPVIELGIDSSEFGANDHLVIFANVDRQGLTSTLHSGFLLLYWAKDPASDTVELGDAWLEVFGLPVVGQKVYLRVYRQNTEQLRSDYQQISSVFQEAT